MKRKFSTLLAGVLLAGSMSVGSVFAEVASINPTAIVAIEEAAEDTYYALHVHGSSKDNVAEGNLLYWDGNQLTHASNVEAKWVVEKSGQLYKLKDADGNYLAFKYVEGASSLSAAKDGDVNAFYFTSQKRLVTDIAGTTYYLGNLNSNGSAAVLLRENLSDDHTTWWAALTAIAPNVYDKAELEDLQGGKFGIQIGYYEKKSGDDKAKWYEYTNFEGGNVFAGDLYVGEGSEEGGYALYTDSKKTQRIVLLKEKWDEYTSASGEGYKFKVMTAKEYVAEQSAADDKKTVLSDKFRISVPANVDGEPLEVVALGENDATYEVVVAVIKKANGDKVNRLTVANGYSNKLADYTHLIENSNHNTWIKFGNSNAVDMTDFIGKLWNIYKNDQIASPNCAKYTSGNYKGQYVIEWVPASQVAAAYPEGQWLYNIEDNNFYNRESGKTLALSGLRYVDGKTNVFVNGEDTYTFVEAGEPSDKATTGYLNGYTEDLLKQKAFFIGTPIVATGDTVYLAKATGGKLEFVKDKADAVEFRLTMKDFDGKDDDATSFMSAQTITEYTAWKDKSKGTTEQKNDILHYHQYAVSEAVTGDVLYYDATNDRFALGEEYSDENEDGVAPYVPVVFKNKAENTYNILFSWGENSAFANYDSKEEEYVTIEDGFCGSFGKLYGAHNTAELVGAETAYDFIQNDLFVVVDADAQQYRGDFSNTGVLDTIKIFRNDDNSYVLYEKGELLKVGNEVKEGFLGMENFYDPQYAQKQPALLADTAFYSNTYRPQYMLAVDAVIEADGWTCPYNPEHNTAVWRDENGGHCGDAVKDRPYISGRYLVNLVDSAKACDNAIKNKFTYELYETGKPYYRLGFVQAIHVGDSLIITSTNDTIDLANNPLDKVCTFAFKYVDAQRDAFTIETLYNYSLDDDGDVDVKSLERGYIKYHNGVPVVTPKASEAWVFDLEVLQGVAPTANDEIAASEVSVVATSGAVVVKGAAGKKVAINNILGQTVANTVIASDNETIAAPAGIVVVAVEGEDAVKVVVK